MAISKPVDQVTDTFVAGDAGRQVLGHQAMHVRHRIDRRVIEAAVLDPVLFQELINVHVRFALLSPHTENRVARTVSDCDPAGMPRRNPFVGAGLLLLRYFSGNDKFAVVQPIVSGSGFARRLLDSSFQRILYIFIFRHRRVPVGVKRKSQLPTGSCHQGKELPWKQTGFSTCPKPM